MKSLFMCLTLIVSGFFVISQPCYASSTLKSGSSVSGYLASYATDTFSFTGASGQDAYIMAQVDNSLLISIYKPDGTFLVHGNKAVFFGLPSTGTYTVEIIFLYGRNGAYELQHFLGASTVENGSLFNGSNNSKLLNKYDLDSYSFTGSVSDIVTITATGAQSNQIVLFNPDGSHNSTSLAYKSLTLSEAGRYTVLIKLLRSQYISTYNLTFTNSAALGSVNDKRGAYGSYIDGSMGFKHQQETDYSGGLLSFTRSYRSDASWFDSMGARWRHNLDREIILDTATAKVLTASGSVLSFEEQSAGVWVASDSDVTTTFEPIMDGLTLTGYLYTTISDAKEFYDTSGKITRIEYLGGGALDFTQDGSGRLSTVTNESSLSLTFAYNASDEITSVVTPNGTFTYSYDGNGNLTGVTKPDTKTLTYHYENTTFVNALTGITDEENIRFVTYAYNSIGQATSTVYAGGVGSYSMAYNADDTTTVTNSLNQDEVHHFQTIHGVRKPVLIERSASANVTAASKLFSYDVDGFIDSQTDWNGNTTDYVRDNRGLVTSQVEAVGTGAERTTTISYEPNTRQRNVVSVSGKTTDYDYDTEGRVLTETVTDTATSETRITTYTYHSDTVDANGNTVLGKMATMDGARTSVSDTTSYTYDANNRLTKTTNALGHETETLTFDSADRPLTQLDENGVQTTLTYDTLGRLATSTKASAVTSYTYDAVGNVLTVTQPNGVIVTNTYDDARRLTGVTDSLGNTITYTLDNAGNRTAEVYKDSGGTLKFTQSQVFDTVSRLLESIDANLDKTVNAYDDNGNVTDITDGNLNPTTQAFDGLNRLVNSTDALSGQTVNSINELDQKTGVTDPRSNLTTYAYNAFGDVITQTSPDTGVTTFTVDKAGNTLTRTDARGEVVTYTYDALNRLLSTSYASDSSLNVTLAYDAASGCGSSKGRLCSVTDAGGITAYVYDTKGLLTSVTETRGLLTFTKSYAYDAAGTLSSITYPSGRVVTYGLNAEGQVSSVTDGSNTLASSISYMPFGGMDSLTYGNGVVLTNAYNTAYQLTSKQHGSLFYDTYVYDAVGNITSKSSTTYNYDALYRLTGEDSDSYTYDAIANRLTETVGGVGETYTYPSTSSTLTDIGLTPIVTDAAGNITTDNQRSYSIDAAGHIKTVTIGGTVVGTYVYDANNQRVSKIVGGVTTHYVYGKNGLLYGEYDNTGALIREYVWLDSQPLAQVDSSSTTYLHTDHLGTPRIGSNGLGSSVWDWDSDAFGNGIPTGSATVNLRFAGQYFDTESDLHYNWNRYYDPKTGRYVSSDPIGLKGGLNTFAYVAGNPVMFFDPEGNFADFFDNLFGGKNYKAISGNGWDNLTKAFEDFPQALYDDLSYVANLLVVEPARFTACTYTDFFIGTWTSPVLMKQVAYVAKWSGYATFAGVADSAYSCGKSDHPFYSGYPDTSHPLDPI